MAPMTQERREDLEGPIVRIGTDLATKMPRPKAVSAARVERRMQELLMSDPALRAALFRFVDVRPACATPADVTRHLHELLADAEESRLAGRAAGITSFKLATHRRGDQLLDALEGLLEHGGDVADAAKALSMHRATLYRRLERIEEITGFDLAKGDDRLLAHLGLRLLRLNATTVAPSPR